MISIQMDNNFDVINLFFKKWNLIIILIHGWFKNCCVIYILKYKILFMYKFKYI